jgi:FlaA1/EpsC-like NDP-sugar epimerase
VLGSSGSVVPRILEQIRTGGPVTLTHPDMQRYFLLIPEAVSLVLQAATLASGGGILVLDMGQPIRILDMARNLIRFAGYSPDEEVRIEFTGPRPGEKLTEDLIGDDETVEPSGVPGVLRVRSHRPIDAAALCQDISVLVRYATREDAYGVLRQLRRIVPSFSPDPSRWPVEPIPSAGSIHAAPRRPRGSRASNPAAV